LEEERGERIEIEGEEAETKEESGGEDSGDKAPGTEDEMPSGEAAETTLSLEEQLGELNDKYLRLYAEFENYRKRMLKDKEELVRFANETILHELLPSIDNLEIALQHTQDDTSVALVEGVEASLRELKRTIEKLGLKPIEAEGKPFDPAYHHAMTQVKREDVDENMVVEEFRKGYMYKDKVLRPSLVSVSRNPSDEREPDQEDESTKKDEKEES
jgi:molecular chaperone GrpE